ncbi:MULTISPECIES: glycosyltransferase family 4 protein [unclassified Paenibacillus]|uniref:glycosyltransferase family 4 protein n=1 Tax=unclassified Paenibacillus TaxID=185978 RepID=UPI00095507F8|nr:MULTISPECIES: glycosyltransferase family 4 protein [unclassified Paenibacillus]ASS68980.1 glycosyltransferase family 4 protein [Paenibacillus sp. RUD330]SIR12255.1 Glycosyl transferases group 1 [Paenibacillus sp. RU4X]SIR25088.1 Glycosyl transferases group 1 [Paenibacillus sp. RU4T]
MISNPTILFFSHICSPDAITGAEKLLLLTMTELAGAAACILAVPEEGILSARARAAGIKVHVTGAVPIYYSMYQAHPAILEEVSGGVHSPGMESLYRLLIAVKPHAVWVNTCVHPLPAIAATRLGVPVIWCLTETMRTSAGTGSVQELMEAHTDLLVGISASTLSPIHFPSLLAKSSVLYPAVDGSDFEPWTWTSRRARRRAELNVAEHQCLIGFIASHLYENKGLDHFMAMALHVGASHPDAVFAVTGNPVDPPYLERCLHMAASSGMADRFRWLPFETDIRNAYPALDILVVPSIVEEGFGMTALEGMMFGKPVVAYASGGLAEIMRATGNAERLAAAGNPYELAALVSQLTANMPLRLAVAARSGAAALEVFGLPAYRSRLTERIRQLQLSGLTSPRIVHGSGGQVCELKNWQLRPFRSPQALAEAGYAHQAQQEMPDAVLALLGQGEPIGSDPPPQEEMAPPAGHARAASRRASSGSRRASRRRKGRGRRKGGMRLRKGRALSAGRSSRRKAGRRRAGGGKRRRSAGKKRR